MADSSADLLFRISADSTVAQGDLAALRGAVSTTFGGMIAESHAAAGVLLYDWAGRPVKMIADDFAGMGDAAGGALRRTGSATRETREALRGLGEEMGVRMPRFVSGWLASLGPVAGIMSAAFAPIAVIGLIEVLGKIPEALEKGIGWLHGWTAAAKKAFEETTKDALEFQERTIRLNERLRAIALIGKEGMEKYHLEAVLNSQDFREVANKVDELNAKLTKYKEIAGVKPAGWVEEYKTYLQLVDEAKKAGKEAPAPAFGPSEKTAGKEEIDKAKIQIKELEPIIKALMAQLDDLAIKGKEIPAQAAAEAAKGGKKAVEDFRGLSAVLQEVQGKLAGMAGAEAKAEEEYVRLAAAANKALDEVRAKQAAGKLGPGVADRELADWQRVMALLPGLYTATMDAIAKKRAEKTAEAAAQIKRQLAEEGAQTLAGKLAAFDAEIEAQALTYQREGTLSTANWELLVEKWKDGRAKLTAEQAKANAKEIEELQKQLAEETGKSVEAEHKALDRKLNLEAAAAMREERATQELVDAIAAVRAAGHAKIDRDNAAAFAQELARLDEQLKQVESRDSTSQQRIVAAYKADTGKINAEEAEKTAKFAGNEAERAAIATRYAAIRGALLTKEQTELQALKNSQGWQGVFGNEFAAMIRGDEALWNEWGHAVNQSHMLVRVSLEAMKEDAQKAFQEFAQGEGAAIANALVYEKSVGKAMEAALKSTLASLAAQAAAQAIYCLGWGIWDLAIRDYEGAGQAFAAAAIFGSLAGVAGVAGRAIPGDTGAATGAGAAGAGVGGQAGSGASGGAGSGGYGTAAGQGGAHVTVNVQGHLVGWPNMSEFASAMNDAVINSDVQLTATNTKTGVQVTR